MTGFALRAARSTDAGRVAAILSDFVDETPWMPRIHTRAEDLSHAGAMIDRGWVTVAEEDGSGEITGFSARRGTEVLSLYVAATARRLGCGSALMADLKSQSAELQL